MGSNNAAAATVCEDDGGERGKGGERGEGGQGGPSVKVFWQTSTLRNVSISYRCFGWYFGLVSCRHRNAMIKINAQNSTNIREILLEFQISKV